MKILELLTKKVDEVASARCLRKREVVSEYLKVNYSTYFRWCSGSSEPSPVSKLRIKAFIDGKRTDVPQDILSWMEELIKSAQDMETVKSQARDLLSCNV